jgi:hypothetical protein
MLYESSTINTFADGLLVAKSLLELNENIGFAIAMLSKIIAIHRIISKKILFGVDRLMHRLFNSINK